MKRLTILLTFWATGCATIPEQVNYALNSKEEKLMNDNGNLIFQRQVALEAEISRVTNNIFELQEKTFGHSKFEPGGLYVRVKACHRKLADPRIGGTNLEAVQPWQNIPKSDWEYRFELDKETNSVVGKTQEMLRDRLARLQGEENLLHQKYDFLTERLDVCEFHYEQALIQHGIDPEASKAKGEWVDGEEGYKVWRLVKPATSSPQEMLRRQQEAGL